MEIEEQNKSKITENRLIPISFYERKKQLGETIEFQINKNNSDSAWNVLSDFSFKTINEHPPEREKCRLYFNKKQILTFYNEFVNCYLSIDNSLNLSLLYLEEIKIHFADNFKIPKPTADAYLTELIFQTKLYLEFTLILQISFFDKISQFLNIYFNAKLSIKNVDFNKLKMKIESQYEKYETYGLKISHLKNIMNVKDLERNGIVIFNEINKTRRNIIHRIGSVINKYYNTTTLKEFEEQQTNAKHLLEFCGTTIDNINSLIIDNRYNISKLY